MKKGLLITYIALGVITVGGATPAIIWASQDTTVVEGEELPLSLTLSEEVRCEYIEGQKFNAAGIKFSVENEEIKLENIKTEYDFNASGTRIVKFTYTQGKKTYVAKLPVTVYHVSHIDVRNDNIVKKGDEWDHSKLVVYAEVNGNPSSFNKPNPLYQNVIELSPDDYTVTVNETEVAGKYHAEVSVGKNKDTIAYYDDAKFPSKRVLSLYNTAQSGETLTLYVDYNTSGFIFPDESSDIVTGGTYVFVDNAGNHTNYPFTYHLTPGWGNDFNSPVATSITGDGGLLASINNINFTATAQDWHDSVLGNPEEVEKYTVTYNADGGTGNMDSVSNVRGGFDLPQTNFIAPGEKAFSAWLVSGDEKRDCDNIKVYANTEVKAVWSELPDVDADRILHLTNNSSTEDKLTLYVETTDAPEGFIFPDAISETITVGGQYLFERADGVKILYPFLYTLSPTWESSFKSNSLNWRIADAQSGDDYTCTINNINFSAVAQDWHDAILGKEGEHGTYTITFDNNSGTGTISPITDYYGDYALPKNTLIAPEGKAFKAWEVNSKEYGYDDHIAITKDTVVKAIWMDIPDVDAARVLNLTNKSGTTDKLTMYVTDTTNPGGFVWPTDAGSRDYDIVVTGYYLFEDGSGAKSIYPFKYKMAKNSWTSIFESNSVNWRVSDFYITDEADESPNNNPDPSKGINNEDMIAIINGITFHSPKDEWHLPILGIE